MTQEQHFEALEWLSDNNAAFANLEERQQELYEAGKDSEADALQDDLDRMVAARLRDTGQTPREEAVDGQAQGSQKAQGQTPVRKVEDSSGGEGGGQRPGDGADGGRGKPGPGQIIEGAQQTLSKLRTEIERLSRESRENPLTGGLNRREFERLLKLYAQEADAAGQPFAFIAFDAANLKSVNDNEGEAAGDAYLKSTFEAIAAVTRSGTDGRPADAFHYGGDEFAMLVAGADAAQAAIIRDRAEKAVGRAAIKRKDGSTIEGVSRFLVGDVAAYTPDSGDTAALWSTATEAMKKRKAKLKADAGEAVTREEAEKRGQAKPSAAARTGDAGREAFEAWARRTETPYVNVGEAQKYIKGPRNTLTDFDFVVYSRETDNLLVTFEKPGEAMTSAMREWGKLFGSGFTPVYGAIKDGVPAFTTLEGQPHPFAGTGPDAVPQGITAGNKAAARQFHAWSKGKSIKPPQRAALEALTKAHAQDRVPAVLAGVRDKRQVAILLEKDRPPLVEARGADITALLDASQKLAGVAAHRKSLRQLQHRGEMVDLDESQVAAVDAIREAGKQNPAINGAYRRIRASLADGLAMREARITPTQFPAAKKALADLITPPQEVSNATTDTPDSPSESAGRTSPADSPKTAPQQPAPRDRTDQAKGARGEQAAIPSLEEEAQAKTSLDEKLMRFRAFYRPDEWTREHEEEFIDVIRRTEAAGRSAGRAFEYGDSRVNAIDEALDEFMQNQDVPSVDSSAEEALIQEVRTRIAAGFNETAATAPPTPPVQESEPDADLEIEASAVRLSEALNAATSGDQMRAILANYPDEDLQVALGLPMLAQKGRIEIEGEQRSRARKLAQAIERTQTRATETPDAPAQPPAQPPADATPAQAPPVPVEADRQGRDADPVPRPDPAPPGDAPGTVKPIEVQIGESAVPITAVDLSKPDDAMAVIHAVTAHFWTRQGTPRPHARQLTPAEALAYDQARDVAQDHRREIGVKVPTGDPNARVWFYPVDKLSPRGRAGIEEAQAKIVKELDALAKGKPLRKSTKVKKSPVRFIPAKPARAKDAAGVYKAISKGSGFFKEMPVGVRISENGGQASTTSGSAAWRIEAAPGTFGEDGVFYAGGRTPMPDGASMFPTDFDGFWQNYLASATQALDNQDVVTLLRRVKQASTLADDTNPTMVLVSNPDRSLGFAAGTYEAGHGEVNVHEGFTDLGSIHPDPLLESLTFLYAAGADTITAAFTPVDAAGVGKAGRVLVLKGSSAYGHVAAVLPFYSSKDGKPVPGVETLRSQSDRPTPGTPEPPETAPRETADPQADPDEDGDVAGSPSFSPATGQTTPAPAPGSPPGQVAAPAGAAVPGTKGYMHDYDPAAEPEGQFRRTRADKPARITQAIAAARARRDGGDDKGADNIYKIISDLARRFGLGPPGVGRARLLKRWATGFYRIGPEAVRLGKGSYVATFVHELGHHLHKVMFLRKTSSKGQLAAEDFPRAWRPELVKLGQALYGTRKPKVGGYATEGWAEVVRFLVTNPAHLKKEAPVVYQAVVSALVTAHPVVWATLLEGRVRLLNAIRLADVDPIDQHIAHDAPRSWWSNLWSGSWLNLWDDLRTRLFDRFQRLRTFKRDLRLDKLPVTADPHLAALRANGHIAGDVKAAIENGTFNPDDPFKTPTGPGLREILTPVRHSLRLWQNYMVARRTLEKRRQGYNVLGVPGRVLRAGATQYNPSFFIPNWMRDFTQALTTTHTDLAKMDQQTRLRLTGMKQAFIGGKYYDLFLASGADMSGLFGEYYNPREARIDFERLFAPTQALGLVKGENAGQMFRDMMRLGTIDRLNRSFEMANRLGEFAVSYEQARKQRGTTDREAIIIAGQAAADITLDFQRGGTWSKQINEVVPFFNAAMLGADKLGRFIAENPLKALGRITSLILVPSLAGLLLNIDNDDYWAKPKEQRDRYWFFPTGYDDKGRPSYLKIPKPYGLAAFSIAFERGFASLFGLDPETGERGDP